MNIDVKPTIMGLLGIDEYNRTDGRDISGTLLGTDDWAGHPYAFSETFYGRSNKATIISASHQLIRSTRKRKTPPVVERLYEHSDPLAKNNLIGTGLEVEADLQARLDTWVDLMQSNWDQAGEPSQTEIEPELQKQLQALGYME